MPTELGTPAWSSEKVTGTAPQLRFHNAFYNAPNNDMVVFGGLKPDRAFRAERSGVHPDYRERPIETETR